MESQKQDWDAGGYHSNSSVQLKAAKDLINEISFIGNEAILDIGCGDGKITNMLSELANHGSVLGVDLSKEMIEFAKKKFENKQPSNISFDQQDARCISYDNQFDLIFSSYALHWVINFDDFLKRVYKALKPGGKILFTIPLGISSPLEEASVEIMRKSKWAKYFEDYEEPWQFSPRSEYHSMLTDANFEVKKCNEFNHKKIFESKDDYRNYIVQWYPYPHQVEESMREEFFNEIIERALELETIFSDGKVNFEFPQIDIIASKK